MIHHYPRAGHAECDIYVKSSAALMMVVWCIDHDMAACDTAKITVKVCGLLLNAEFCGRRWLHVTEGDMRWSQCHNESGRYEVFSDDDR